MRFKQIAAISFLAFGFATLPVAADDVTGAQQFLCAIVEVNFCSPDDDECESGPPWAWNVPSFIEVDLAKKELRTTQASKENRATPIRTQLKEDGQIIVAGVEKGRAFTFFVTERTGEATITVATYGEGGVAFGTCTPMPAAR